MVGGSVRHVDRLRKAVDAAESAAQDVTGYRKTATALHAADERTAALRREMEQTGKPTRTLRRDFARAGAESRRLATRLGSQSRALKAAGVDVRRLGVEERRLNRTLREQRAALDNVEAAMRRRDAARGRREAARGSMVEAGALAYAAVRPLQAVVGAAVEFEEKMADVGKVVDFAAPDGLRLMGRDIRRLSKEIPVTAAGIADIVAAAGQAGVADGRDELLRFAADTSKVAVAFDLTGAAAGEAMAGVRKIFGLGQAAAMDLAGAYNHLSNNLGASAPGLLKVGEVAGSNAQLIGLSARQLAALGTTLLDLKTPPAEAATALNSMPQQRLEPSVVEFFLVDFRSVVGVTARLGDDSLYLPDVVLSVRDPAAGHFIGGRRVVRYQVVNKADELDDQPVDEIVVAALERVVHARQQLSLALRVVSWRVPLRDELDRRPKRVTQLIEHLHRREFANLLLVELEALGQRIVLRYETAHLHVAVTTAGRI